MSLKDEYVKLKEDYNMLKKSIDTSEKLFNEVIDPDVTVNAKRFVDAIRGIKGVMSSGEKTLSWSGAMYLLTRMEQIVIELAKEEKKMEVEHE